MAEKFYSLEEAVEKLGKNEDEVRKLVKDGKLREFRFGQNISYKVEDIEALKTELEESEIDLVLDDTGEIALEPNITDEAKSEGGFNLSNVGDLTGADTNIGTTGISVIGETDDGYKLAEDSKAETKADDEELADELGSLDADANMESFGSGSGLLDLSLQADDTSLGAVLDDILPAGDEAVSEGAVIEEAGMDEEADQVFEEKEPEAVPAITEAGQPAQVRVQQRYFELEPDASSNAYGRALFVPLVAMFFLAIVVGASKKDVIPALVKSVSGSAWGGYAMIWYLVAALVVVFFLVIFIGGLLSGKKDKSNKGDVFQQPA
jgi:hypothetical protein